MVLHQLRGLQGLISLCFFKKNFAEIQQQMQRTLSYAAVHLVWGSYFSVLPAGGTRMRAALPALPRW